MDNSLMVAVFGIGGTVLGALIIQLFSLIDKRHQREFDLEKMKTERAITLAKELYFDQQKQVEKLSELLYQVNESFRSMRNMAKYCFIRFNSEEKSDFCQKQVNSYYLSLEDLRKMQAQNNELRIKIRAIISIHFHSLIESLGDLFEKDLVFESKYQKMIEDLRNMKDLTDDFNKYYNNLDKDFYIYFLERSQFMDKIIEVLKESRTQLQE